MRYNQRNRLSQYILTTDLTVHHQQLIVLLTSLSSESVAKSSVLTINYDRKYSYDYVQHNSMVIFSPKLAEDTSQIKRGSLR